jgi:Vitamin K-dependent gamma-carboxylase
VKSIWKCWQNFWFKPISPASIAIYRMLIGLLLLQTFLVQLDGDFLNWFGKDAAVNLETVRHTIWHDSPHFDALLMFYQQDWALKVYFFSLVTASFCLLIGFATRFSSGYLCLGLISMQNHCFPYVNGGDNFMRFATLFMTFSAAGDYLSVDAMLAKRRNGSHEPSGLATWGQRMIQLQLTLVYANTFFAKIVLPSWHDGTAVYYTVHYDDLVHLPAFGILDNIEACRVLSWYTLIVEGSMFSLVWIPKLRNYVLAAALLLHLGMDWCLNLPVFEFVFIATLITFVPGESVEKVLRKLERLLPQRFRRFGVTS